MLRRSFLVVTSSLAAALASSTRIAIASLRDRTHRQSHAWMSENGGQCVSHRGKNESPRSRMARGYTPADFR